MVAGHDGVLLDGPPGEPAAVRRVAPADGHPLQEAILLGLENGRAVFALDNDAAADGAADESLTPLREAVATLPHPEGGLASYTAALLNWHRRHRYCANCGAATTVTEAGYARHCPRCGAQHFPRTDPVVIMTVEHERRLLLGGRPGWPAQQFSVLAGFISPGESAEEAVVREVHEESGILASDPVYVSSQPWPFPASLMLGFAAQAEGGEPQVKDGELREVRWFAIDDVRAALRDENPDLRLPPPISIARVLIEHWLALHDG